MCGIFGQIGPAIDRNRAKCATDVLVHRGPDASGYWFDENAFLGHRRLRIIDLSDAGAQPMPNEDGSILVTFNGEIYNYPELKAELIARGHVFRGKSDTEVIVHAYEEYGDACVERLWGMFAFALWDTKRKRLLAARDRFGKKPLVYVHKGDRLAFASEIPALLETDLPDRRLDLGALASFWQSDAYIPAPQTAFADIRKLPAGHWMTFEAGRLDVHRYYPPREVAPFAGTYDDAKAELRSLLDDAVARRLVSDVPVGIALSGGVDSAIILAAARERTPGRLVTLNVRPHEDGSEHDEGVFARATAERFGAEYHEIRPQPDFRESFETVIRHMGEPFATASAIPAFYLFKALGEYATVVLTGDGADESFAGYSYYRSIKYWQTLRSVTPGFVAAGMYAGFDRLYAAVPRARPKLKLVLAGLQMARGRPFTDARSENLRLLKPAAFASWLNSRPMVEFHRELLDLTNTQGAMRRQMTAEMFGRMTYHINAKVDICSMSHSIESRSPLMDHRIAEFARSLPTEFLVQPNTGKRILRDLFAAELPASVSTKRKTGFALPIRDLLANQLRQYALDLLTSPHPTYDALVNRDAIPELLRRHATAQPNCTQLLMKLIALRLWIENTNPVIG